MLNHSVNLYDRQAWVVKAQVHAGGRGKAGGIVLVENKQDLVSAISSMLGTRLVTKQTGEDGLPIHAVLIEETAQVSREFYLALLVDRERVRSQSLRLQKVEWTLSRLRSRCRKRSSPNSYPGSRIATKSGAGNCICSGLGK